MSKAPYTPKLGDVFEKKDSGVIYRWKGYTGGGQLLFVRVNEPNPVTDIWVAGESYILDFFTPVVNAEREPLDPVNQPQDGVKYLREIKPGVYVDVYDVLRAFAVVNPALQHLIKKALAVGQRGHKDAAEDLQNIYESAKRAIELEQDNA